MAGLHATPVLGVFLVSFLAFHSRLSTAASSNGTCLPSALLAAAPSCSYGCISTFVEANYQGQSCANMNDLTYLCTTENLSGMTIREGSVQCVISICDPSVAGSNVSVYYVCQGVAGALPETAAVIAATIKATFTGGGSLTAITGLQTSSASSISSSTRGLKSPAPMASPTGSMTEVPTPPQPTSSTNVESPPRRSKQSAAAKVGIAIGVTLGILCLVVAIAYIVLLQRGMRRSQRTLDRWGIEWKSELQGDTHQFSKSAEDPPVSEVRTGTRSSVAELEGRERTITSDRGSVNGAVPEHSRPRVQSRWYELAA